MFVDSEALASSNGHRTIRDNVFRSQLLKEALQTNHKAEMNSNSATWKLLQKKLTTFIKKQGITNELGQVSIDEAAECAIYDSL